MPASKKTFLILAALALFALPLLFVSCSGSRMSNDELLRAAAQSAEQGKWSVARGFAQKAVKQNPQDVNALVMLSLCLEHCGQLEPALDEAKKAVKLGADNFMAQFTLGRLLFMRNNYADAVAPLKSADKLKPGNMDTVVLLAQCLASLSLYDDALRYYALMIKDERFKSRPEPWNEIGVLYLKKNDLTRGAQCFAQAYKNSQENPIVILNLAVLFDKYLNKPANARAWYEKYLGLTQNNKELELKRKKVQERIAALSAPAAG